MQDNSLHKDFAKTFLWSLAALFLVPALTLWFTTHSLNVDQQELNSALTSHIEKSRDLSVSEQQEMRDFYARHPMATLCFDDAEEAARLKAKSCPRYGELWQFTWMRTIAIAALVGGALVLLWLGVLGAMAFVNRGWQYASFVTGWRTLTVASTATVLVQGTMVVWLSFWVTAFFTHKYYPKLIIVAALAALVAAFVVIVHIFHRSPEGSAADGELVSESDAPHLWRRIRDIAQRLKTPAPDHLVAGIDANFFVTEAPLSVGEHTLQGRKLYVSIPLLRQLNQEEADAVLAHELAHLSGGDARSSAALGPKLSQFDRYMGHLYEGGLSRVVLPFLQLYRMIFQLALSRDSRAREFRADRFAAKLVSPRAISHSLIKIAAYASYRADVESGLFSRDERLDANLGIGHRVATGLPQWTSTPAFADALAAGQVPHPYDSHPPLNERMTSVGHVESETRFASIVTQPVGATWVDAMLTAEQIESRLWAGYEQGFAAEHEQDLAYRYEPATETERALVLKYFPPQRFVVKDGGYIEVTYAGVTAPDQPEIGWDAIKGLEFKESTFGNVLIVQLHEKGMIGSKTEKIKLSGMNKEQRELFGQTLSHYWQRHQFMRAYRTSPASRS